LYATKSCGLKGGVQTPYEIAIEACAANTSLKGADSGSILREKFFYAKAASSLKACEIVSQQALYAATASLKEPKAHTAP
jgi:hypothetical protein